MIRLRLRRRSLAIAGAACLAAAALVAVTVPASADAEDASVFVHDDYLKHELPQLICGGPVTDSPATAMVA